MTQNKQRKTRGKNRISGSGAKYHERQIPVELVEAFIYQKCGGGRRVIRKGKPAEY